MSSFLCTGDVRDVWSRRLAVLALFFLLCSFVLCFLYYKLDNIKIENIVLVFIDTFAQIFVFCIGAIIVRRVARWGR